MKIVWRICAEHKRKGPSPGLAGTGAFERAMLLAMRPWFANYTLIPSSVRDAIVRIEKGPQQSGPLPVAMLDGDKNGPAPARPKLTASRGRNRFRKITDAAPPVCAGGPVLYLITCIKNEYTSEFHGLFPRSFR
jgi:hypothetical protein